MGSKDDNRMQRIESKLTRLILGLGMDCEGNPDGGVVIGEEFFNELLAAIDKYMLLLDKMPIAQQNDEEYNDAESLYNRLVSIRRAKWAKLPDNET